MKIQDVLLQGKSGQRHNSEVHAWGLEMERGVVYAALRHDGPHYTVLYIGQTGDQAQRFANHHKAEAFRQHRAADLAILREGSEERRRAVERDLVANYGPPLNKTAHG